MSYSPRSMTSRWIAANGRSAPDGVLQKDHIAALYDEYRTTPNIENPISIRGFYSAFERWQTKARKRASYARTVKAERAMLTPGASVEAAQLLENCTKQLSEVTSVLGKVSAVVKALANRDSKLKELL